MAPGGIVTHETRVAYFLRAIFRELPLLCPIIGSDGEKGDVREVYPSLVEATLR